MERRNQVFVVLASGFVLLGMATTTPGVTWPSVAESFGRPLAELGLVTLLFGSGYTLSSAINGRLIAGRGLGPVLVGSALTGTAALVGLALSVGWPMFLLAIGLLGLGGGLVDAATNTYVAIRRGTRAMSLIHGIFGIGAIGGPLLVTALLQLGLPWRMAFALLAVGQVAYVASLWLVSRRLSVRAQTEAETPGLASARRQSVAWSLAVFFVYAGIGVGAGAWAFTYLTEEQGLSDTAGGLVVAGYWAAFAASRLLLGAVGDRVRPEAMLRWSPGATMVAFLGVWWSPEPWLGAAARIIAGVAHGPVVPMEMLLTARRFRVATTPRMIGFEIAAANIGGAILPAIMGFGVGLAGLGVIPPFLVVNAAVLWVVITLLGRQPLVTRSPEASAPVTIGP